ncbi:MAG: hypothetical protein V7618_08965, partial [Rhodoglobus sp.]
MRNNRDSHASHELLREFRLMIPVTLTTPRSRVAFGDRLRGVPHLACSGGIMTELVIIAVVVFAFAMVSRKLALSPVTA